MDGLDNEPVNKVFFFFSVLQMPLMSDLECPLSSFLWSHSTDEGKEYCGKSALEKTGENHNRCERRTWENVRVD